MNGLDLFILGAVAFAGVRGLRRGLGREAIGLGATALLLFAGLPLAKPLGNLVVEWAWPKAWPYAPVLGFVLLVAGVSFLSWFLTTAWHRVMSTLSLGWFDALGGALFGAAKAVAIWLVLIAFLSWLPVPVVQQALSGSPTAEALRRALPGVYAEVEKVLPRTWRRALPRPPKVPRSYPRGPRREEWQQVQAGGAV